MRGLVLKYLNNVESTNCVGIVLDSKSFGKFEVIKYVNWSNVTVRFIDTGYVKTCDMKEVKTGSIKDYMKPSVYGVGIMGDNYLTIGSNAKDREYEVWSGMIKRCYSELSLKIRPTYIGCTVSDNFKSYEKFYEWYRDQVGCNDKFDLDKDLLVKGNKIYSESTCVLIPPEINNALTKANKIRGKYPVGVHYCNTRKSLIAKINRGGGQQEYLGKFKTAEEAFLAYKTAKEDYLKTLAEKWKGSIDVRAYNALMNYEVEITD